MANTGVDNTQLSSVEVKFSWEGTWRNAGSGTILAGQTGSFSTAATPPSAGTYAVEIKATGTSSGDWLHETIECTSAGTITATPPPTPGFDGAFVMIALVGVGIAAFRRRIRA